MQWLWAAYLVATQAPWLSTLQPQVSIRCYEIAWAMVHKLRRAMVGPDREPLNEKVEVNETYIGGHEVGMKAAGDVVTRR